MRYRQDVASDVYKNSIWRIEMRHSTLSSFFVLIIFATVGQLAIAQIPGTAPAPAQAPAPDAQQVAAAQAPAAPPQICGNTAYCSETNDFAATITSFRITTDAAKRQILDLSIRFQNKTNQQLVLGYVNASGNASDDRGNRLVPWGPNASRGLGLVYGATFDPKFVVRPAGFGDAQFEFYPQGYPQVVGFTYTLDLSVAEINTFEGNQHTLGEEFPLHFQGLRNGSASISPGFSPGAAFGQATSYAPGGIGNAMSNPCAAAGTAGTQVASTVSNAANTISNIGSLFKKKKNAQNGQIASVPACDPNAAAPMPTAAVPTANTAAAPTTNSVQQAVQKSAVPAAASVNPLNPLASKPAQPVANAAQTSTVKTTTTTAANSQAAGVAHNTTATAKTSTPAKPSPAKPAKPQTPKPANATVNQN
jgi:hypothetical protein